jgi:hypothetical protein
MYFLNLSLILLYVKTSVSVTNLVKKTFEITTKFNKF